MRGGAGRWRIGPLSVSAGLVLASALPFLAAALAFGSLISGRLEQYSLSVEFDRVASDAMYFRRRLLDMRDEAQLAAHACLPQIPEPTAGEGDAAYRFEAPGCPALGAPMRPADLSRCVPASCRSELIETNRRVGVAARLVPMGDGGCGAPASAALSGPDGCLYVWRGLAAHDQRLADARQLLFVSIAIAAAATAAVAVLLARRFSRRVKAINDGLRRFADGDRTAVVEAAPEGDELDELGRSVNQALKRIRQDIAASARISGSLSHQLLAPVRQVREAAQRLVDEVRPARAGEALTTRQAQRLADDLDQVEAELGHIVHTGEALQDLLSASRKRRPDELRDPVDLDDICHLAATRFRTKAAQRSIVLRVDTQPVEASSSADAIEQMVSNLIDNAIIYGPANAEITVSCGADAERIWLSVADAGGGPPQHVLDDVFGEHVFAEFTRSARAGAGGHGIGLLFVRQLAENCAIRIGQERIAPKGWRVVLSWPRAAAATDA